MPDYYGGYRDTQRRWMYRPAPERPEGYEARIFGDGETHDTAADGWTHSIQDAINRDRALEPATADAPAPVEPEDELVATLRALRTPALRKLASEHGLPFNATTSADALRSLILQSVEPEQPAQGEATPPSEA